MPKVILKCRECGGEFSRFPSHVGTFCSLSCRSKAKMRDGMPSKPRRGVELPCLVCGKTIYRTQRELKARGSFCSMACHNVHQGRGRLDKKCVWCGAAFAVSASKSEQTTCSRRCRSSLRIKRPLGRVHNGRPAKHDPNGYVMLWEPNHPASYHGWYYEHRIIVERSIGRQLATDEVVHHANGIKDDNRIENLEIMAALEHATLSARDHRDNVNQVLAAHGDLQAELAAYRERFGPLPD